jgi:hypothetical protein
MNAQERVAEKTGTSPSDWEYTNGPDTGVGIEFWLHNTKTQQEAYYCDDQGCISISVIGLNGMTTAYNLRILSES